MDRTGNIDITSNGGWNLINMLVEWFAEPKHWHPTAGNYTATIAMLQAAKL
ncbi:MAG: hypothetical protein IPL63_12550 [Saprospiraceae bacterium]|nr:hypothetical protein [Saprospiraceae bacterium]